MTELFLRPLFDWRSAIASPFGPANPTTRHVLLTLSLHMSVKGDSCFPSIDLLTEESGLSRRAVLAHLSTAGADGWLGKRERPEKNGQGWRRIEYFPLIPQGVEEQVKKWMEERSARRAPPQRGAPGSKGGAPGAPNVVHHVHPNTSCSSSKRTVAGDGTPSPVSQAFTAYTDGIRRKYGVDYPSSAKAMGQLANVVARIGADYVVPVVGFYLGTKNPYYEQRKHSLDVLVRDCERLYIEFQAATGTTGSTAKPATKSEVMLVKEDGSIARRLDEYPVGDFLEIARQAAKDYGRMIASVQPKHIVVRQGEQRRTFTLQEVLA